MSDQITSASNNDTWPMIMGILNVTPDSFSDGGQFSKQEPALAHVRKMITDGADIIDIGGESTRPGAQDVSVDEELQRVIPVIEAIRQESDIPVSIDTSKAAVMREAVAAGASIINDVRALRDEDALETAAILNVPVILMHMQGQPRTMQVHPVYQNVVAEVSQFLRQRIEACINAGIDRENIIIDPGFGFGKTLQHNLSLFKHLSEFKKLDVPLLVGVSRKAMIGAALNDLPAAQRMPASITLAGLATWLGADIIRAHDVRETHEAVKMCYAVKAAE